MRTPPLGLITWLTLLQGCRCVPLLQLYSVDNNNNNNNNNNSTTGLYGPPGILPALSQIDLCVRIKILVFKYWSNILEYGSPNSKFSLGLYRQKMLYFHCCGWEEEQYVELPILVKRHSWHHFCLSFIPTDKQIIIWQNYKETPTVKIVNAKYATQEAIPANGHLIIGGQMFLKNQYASFDKNIPTFQLADLQIYYNSLTVEAMMRYMTCLPSDEISHKQILTLDNDRLEALGKTLLTNISETEPCEPTKPVTIMSNVKYNYITAKNWCTKLGGKLFLAEDYESEYKVYNHSWPSSETCVSNEGFYYWVGVEGDEMSGEWLKSSDKQPITYTTFPYWYQGNATEDIKCIGVINYYQEPNWYPTHCENKMCAACSIDLLPNIFLMGLCIMTSFDHEFVSIVYQNGITYYLGALRTNISLTDGKWMMTNVDNDTLEAVMFPEGSENTPIGRHKWTIKGDTCKERTATLLLSPCGSTLYSCDDGSCIHPEQRCDLLLDCLDGSDEERCELVILPPDYNNRLPPPSDTDDSLQLNIINDSLQNNTIDDSLQHNTIDDSLQHNTIDDSLQHNTIDDSLQHNTIDDSLQLNTSLLISTIREFNLNTFTVVLDTVLSVSWRDSRIKLKNLKPTMRRNKVNTTLVWSPQVEIKDEIMGAVELSHESRTLYAKREGQPMYKSEYIQDILYKGKENTLVMEEKQIITYRCHLNLQHYPFDVQHCPIILYIHDLHTNLGHMVKAGPGVVFEGKRVLLEYQLVSEAMKPYTVDGITYLMVELTFQNLYGYYIGNVFVPSLMMVVVCYLSLFFPVHDFNDRIMVSLTSLLVLSQLFAQTSASIPKTSYLKLVDGWYLALISLDFFIIVTLVAVEVLQQRHVPTKASVGPLMMGTQVSVSPGVTKINSVAQMIFMVTLVLIVAGFIALSQWEWE